MTENLVYICEICQVPLEERQSSNVCPNCGRTLDCSDLPLILAQAKLLEDDRLVLRPGSDPRDLLPPLRPDAECMARGQGLADLP
jgi:hypothetical protein